MKELVLRSYAKLNLYLVVLGKRKDNYHNIKTLFERIGLADKIILKSRPKDKKITVVSNLPSLPGDNANIAYRAAKILQGRLRVNKGADIKLIKRIPVGAGLGGGSSNAAGVLSGLNKIWDLNLSRKKLVSYARQLGADVPFFLYNTSFAVGSGRGDRIRPLKPEETSRLWHVLVVPKIEVSTALIYRKLDRMNFRRAGLTIPGHNVKILISGLKKKDSALVGKALFNSLEQVTIKIYPEVKRVKEKLKQLGLKAILMSGSGPAVFAILSSRKEAGSLGRRLKRTNKSWQVFITRTH